jgi:hypothetical protein
MELTESQTDRTSLERFGQEAAAFLRNGDFGALANRFGYAMAYGREPVFAIEADLNSVPPDNAVVPEVIAPSIAIKYFNADAMESTGLVAAVECITHLADGQAIEFTLVVTGKGSGRYITLEGVNRTF